MEPELINLPVMAVVDSEGNWNNNPLITIKDDDTKENRLIKAKSRLTKYRFEFECGGRGFVDRTDYFGLTTTY